MQPIMPDHLYKELTKLLEGDDENAVREFLIAHLKEFPKKTRDMIVLSFVEEALDNKAAKDKAVADFQQEGLRVLKSMDDEQRQLEKKKKLIELKEGM